MGNCSTGNERKQERDGWFLPRRALSLITLCGHHLEILNNFQIWGPTHYVADPGQSKHLLSTYLLLSRLMAPKLCCTFQSSGGAFKTLAAQATPQTTEISLDVGIF